MNNPMRFTMKSLLLACLAALWCSTAVASPDAKLEAQAQRTIGAIDSIIEVGCWWAARQGKPEACDEIEPNWYQHYRGLFYASMVQGEAIGDHEPYSEFLAEVTWVLKDALGEWLFEQLHLDDLIIFNYGLPVTFSPYADAEWCLEYPDVSCREEYREHAQAVFGVTSYWVAWSACTGASYGTAMVWLCTPLGVAAEKITLRTWGPRLSDKIWDNHNEAG